MNSISIDENFKSIGRFYEDIISEFWEMIHNKQMHVAYFPNNLEEDIAQGSNNLTEFIISRAKISKNQSFLDIGCGFGIPAVLLSMKKECYVTGITASEKQKNEAEEFAQSNNLKHRVDFRVADALNMLFFDNSFDGGWFFESIFHMGHVDALNEANRVLKKGASLLIADFIEAENAKDKNMDLLSDIFYIKSILKFRDYEAVLNKTGFRLENIIDITAQTINMRAEKYRQAISNYKANIIQLGEKLIESNRHNIFIGKERIDYKNSEDFYNKFVIFWDRINHIISITASYGIIEAIKI